MKLLDRIRALEAQEIYYFDSREGFRPEELAKKLMEMIKRELADRKKRGVILLCIGTDCSTGDSLGPLIGYKLQSRSMINIDIMGTLDRPVHAVNLDRYLEHLEKYHSDQLIIAIDASVGRMDHVGYITLGKGSIQPGLGVKKELREVGDIYITGIVGGVGNCDPIMLQSVHLSVVMRLADCISESISLVEKLWDSRA